jgi:hypothetical protein
LLLLSWEKRDEESGDKEDKAKTKDRDIIVFGNDVQDEVIVSVSCLVMMNRT